jgi:hypothetical protein
MSVNKKNKEEDNIEEKKMLSTLLAAVYSPMTFFFLMFIIAVIFIWVFSVGSERTQYLSVVLLMFIVIGNTFFFLRNGKKKPKGEVEKEVTEEVKKDNSYIEDLLGQLGEEYLIIKKDDNNIVVAPAGVFIIETKDTSGHYSAENNELLQNGKAMKEDCLKQSFDQVKDWRGALKDHFQGKPFINVYGRLVFLNTKWVDDKAMALAKRYGLRICINDYILKNLQDYGSKKRLNPEDQKSIFDFIQLMDKK